MSFRALNFVPEHSTGTGVVAGRNDQTQDECPNDRNRDEENREPHGAILRPHHPADPGTLIQPNVRCNVRGISKLAQTAMGGGCSRP